MPFLTLYTNFKKESLPSNFTSDVSKLVAGILGKPEDYVCVLIIPDQIMTFGGSDELCAIVNLTSIGKLGAANSSHSQKIGKFFNKNLGIKIDRMYINFYDAQPKDVGFNGQTFE